MLSNPQKSKLCNWCIGIKASNKLMSKVSALYIAMIMNSMLFS